MSEEEQRIGMQRLAKSIATTMRPAPSAAAAADAEASLWRVLDDCPHAASAPDGEGKVALQRALAVVPPRPCIRALRTLLMLEAATPTYHRALTRRVLRTLMDAEIETAAEGIEISKDVDAGTGLGAEAKESTATGRGSETPQPTRLERRKARVSAASSDGSDGTVLCRIVSGSCRPLRLAALLAGLMRRGTDVWPARSAELSQMSDDWSRVIARALDAAADCEQQRQHGQCHSDGAIPQLQSPSPPASPSLPPPLSASPSPPPLQPPLQPQPKPQPPVPARTLGALLAPPRPLAPLQVMLSAPLLPVLSAVSVECWLEDQWVSESGAMTVSQTVPMSASASALATAAAARAAAGCVTEGGEQPRCILRPLVEHVHEHVAAALFGCAIPWVHRAFFALAQLGIASDCGLLARLPRFSCHGGQNQAALCHENVARVAPRAHSRVRGLSAASELDSHSVGFTPRPSSSPNASSEHGWPLLRCRLREHLHKRCGFRRSMTTPAAHFAAKQFCLVLMLLFFHLSIGQGLDAAPHMMEWNSNLFAFYVFVLGHMYGEFREAKGYSVGGTAGSGGGTGGLGYSSDAFNAVDVAIGVFFSCEFALRAAVVFGLAPANSTALAPDTETSPVGGGVVGVQAWLLGAREVCALVGAVCLWLRLLDAFTIHPNVGPLVKMIVCMLGDLLRFLLVLSVVLAAFASAFVLKFARSLPHLFGDHLRALLTLFSAVHGDFDFAWFDPVAEVQAEGVQVVRLSRFDATLGRLLLVVFVLLGPVLLLNMLIAMLSNTYARIQGRSRLEYQLGWAQLVLHQQRMARRCELPTPLNLVMFVAGQLTKVWRCCCAGRALRSGRFKLKLRSVAMAEILQLLAFWPPLFVLFCVLWSALLPITTFYCWRAVTLWAHRRRMPPPVRTRTRSVSDGRAEHGALYGASAAGSDGGIVVFTEAVFFAAVALAFAPLVTAALFALLALCFVAECCASIGRIFNICFCSGCARHAGAAVCAGAGRSTDDADANTSLRKADRDNLRFVRQAEDALAATERKFMSAALAWHLVEQRAKTQSTRELDKLRAAVRTMQMQLTLLVSPAFAREQSGDNGTGGCVAGFDADVAPRAPGCAVASIPGSPAPAEGSARTSEQPDSQCKVVVM